MYHPGIPNDTRYVRATGSALTSGTNSNNSNNGKSKPQPGPYPIIPGLPDPNPNPNSPPKPGPYPIIPGLPDPESHIDPICDTKKGFQYNQLRNKCCKPGINTEPAPWVCDPSELSQIGSMDWHGCKRPQQGYNPYDSMCTNGLICVNPTYAPKPTPSPTPMPTPSPSPTPTPTPTPKPANKN